MDTNNITKWTGKGLLYFYSAIDPQSAAHPALFSLDRELKEVERA